MLDLNGSTILLTGGTGSFGKRFARKVDGTVLVLSRGTTDLRDARRGVERLRRMGVRNVLGFVFNRVEPRAQDYALYELASGSDAEGNAPFITATS